VLFVKYCGAFYRYGTPHPLVPIALPKDKTATAYPRVVCLLLNRLALPNKRATDSPRYYLACS